MITRLARTSSFYAAPLVLPLVLLFSFRYAGFVADDFLFAATPSRGVVDLVSTPWAHPLGLTVAYRPITSLTYLVNQWVGGFDPVGFHHFNYLLHGLNALLVAVVTRRLSGSTLPGVVAGVAFAVHPVTHESVLWISGRTYPLAAVFSLAAIAWVSTGGRPARWPDHVVLGSLVLLAVLSYEAAVALPLMLLAVMITQGSAGGGDARRSGSRRGWFSRRISEYATRFSRPLAMMSGSI